MTAPPRVLDVGNCGADHGSIQRWLAANFQARVDAADTADEALQAVQSNTFDLVLVNRILDRDGDSGLELVKQMKSDRHGASLPVMLISNFPEYQRQAVEVGAEPGFGKSSLQEPQTVDLLARYLRKNAD